MIEYVFVSIILESISNFLLLDSGILFEEFKRSIGFLHFDEMKKTVKGHNMTLLSFPTVKIEIV